MFSAPIDERWLDATWQSIILKSYFISNFVNSSDKIKIVDSLDHMLIHYLNSEYSFNGFTFGVSYDLKLNKKISDYQLRKLEDEFPNKF